MNSFSERNKQDISERIGKFESGLSFKLPDEYRNFLLHTNGGKPKLRNFTLGQEHDVHQVSHLFGLGLSDHDDLEQNSDLSQYYEIGERIDCSKYLAFGETSGGNVLVIDLTNCQVYLFDHERDAEDTSESVYVALRPLASTFLDFIDLLT